jgi:ATP-dependent DNA helicase DinG
MREEVFTQKKPFIFSSATLANQKSFDYIASSIGVEDYLSFSVSSPFDYDDKMELYLPKFKNADINEKLDYILEKIRQSEGRALILLNNKEELSQLKKKLSGAVSYPIYFEGDEEISTLVSKFQNEEHAILCSIHLWEGLDIPGRSLENVLIFSLPFPPNDPVFTAKRAGVENPFTEVDLPYMLLRLRQGVGRLIRTEMDQGSVHILVDEDIDSYVLQKIKEVLRNHQSKRAEKPHSRIELR